MLSCVVIRHRIRDIYRRTEHGTVRHGRVYIGRGALCPSFARAVIASRGGHNSRMAAVLNQAGGGTTARRQDMHEGETVRPQAFR